jgi:hypothetical protein
VKMALSPRDKRALRRYKRDWPLFAREVLGVYLDPDQEAILRSVQKNRRTVARSGHARGKDFTTAVARLCFLFLCYPCKVICTGPTDRQVVNIMMAECTKLWKNAKFPLGGRFTTHGWRLSPEHTEWFLIGFKAADKATEAWTGFHAPNIMVAVTEASGIAVETYNAIEGLLTGNSRLLMVLNPNQTAGEAYEAFKSKLYAKFTLSCLNAPNVVAGKTIIPGQVDRQWVNDLMQKPGWVAQVAPGDERPEEHDFLWDMGDGRGPRWYRPSDLFLVKVMGEWPREPEGQLIPLAWVEAAHQRWHEWEAAGKLLTEPLRLGVDVAGMGSDSTVTLERYGDIISELVAYGQSDHMATAGRIKNILDTKGRGAFVDTIGEGAGVYSRLQELCCEAASAKFSESAKYYRDLTGERTFLNMRAYCYWAIRDALDPKLGGKLALPLVDELTQDLTAPRWSVNSQGKVVIEPKEDIRERLGRSPDYGDALALTYFPKATIKVESGALQGVGAW